MSQRLTASLQVIVTVPVQGPRAHQGQARGGPAGVEKVKIRSSANAEDVPNFNGAGLHDSFSATVDKDDDGNRCRIEIDAEGGSEVKRKVKPKTVACAVKGVYASLWNKRAIEERSFARIDHSTAAIVRLRPRGRRHGQRRGYHTLG